MAITSGFFDSLDGDRLYDADQMSTYFEGLISDGVYENVGDKFLVSAASGLSVTVASGRAIIKSHWIKNDADTVLTLDAADIQNPRIDAIALKLDAEARSISLVVKKGTPAEMPVIPDITRNDTVYEIYIASVLVGKNASQVTAITDLRPSSYCGWVTGIVKQVDTSQLFMQWQAAYERQFAAFDAYITAKQAAFDAWFSTLTSQLTVDTTITKYTNSVWTGEGDNGAFVGIAEYNKNTDVLIVYVNGLYLAEGVDYDVVTLPMLGDGIKLEDGRIFHQNDRVDFVVFKSIPGGEVIAPVNAMAIGNAFYSGLIFNTEQIEGGS